MMSVPVGPPGPQAAANRSVVRRAAAVGPMVEITPLDDHRCCEAVAQLQARLRQAYAVIDEIAQAHRASNALLSAVLKQVTADNRAQVVYLSVEQAREAGIDAGQGDSSTAQAEPSVVFDHRSSSSSSSMLRTIADQFVQLLERAQAHEIALCLLPDAYRRRFGRTINRCGHSLLSDLVRSLSAIDDRIDIRWDGTVATLVGRFQNSRAKRARSSPNVCAFYNMRQGCRFSARRCSFPHVCSQCGSEAHGASSCPTDPRDHQQD